MPVFVEVVVVVAIMLGAFFGVFLLIFLFAMAMLPVEKSISKVVWEMTAPPPKRTVPAQEGGFKGFSQKQQKKPGGR